jgi:ubiquinol-cytochrome c reductase cytochrome c subunit
VQIAEAMLVGPGTMPAFGFDEEQLSAITAYVEYIRDAPSPGGVGLGGLGPVPEGFVAIVVGLLLLVVAAKWIAGRRPA